jgi:thiol-disulfide isomerase/thioredoxin
MKRLNCIAIFVVLVMNNSYLLAQTSARFQTSPTLNKVKVISFKTLETLFNQPNDTTYIVNFFASWCAPCVKELPEFIAFAEQHKNEKIHVLFVSLDFKKDLKKSLGHLSIKHDFGQNLYLLDETNANNWINQVDSTWSGDIPATLFINNQKNYNKLFNQSFTNDLLFKTVKLIAQ